MFCSGYLSKGGMNGDDRRSWILSAESVDSSPSCMKSIKLSSSVSSNVVKDILCVVCLLILKNFKLF